MGNMKTKSAAIAVLMMLAATSVLADDQTAYITRIRANPVEDFSQSDDATIISLSEADALVYAQDHKGAKLGWWNIQEIGLVHAFNHHLIGQMAGRYNTGFSAALKALNNAD
jgi:hypothetical protein